ncbi:MULTISPECIES: chemotaxis protein CheW [Sphingomonas]|uniref:Chemotaxis protein CheW n=1 Tax=Sphingomonas lycopersici TaxID=2951807 RepID=A0AA42CTM4_9SPHN|nr:MULTISPECIES: chemotaxis protein CheW [Sphingomonas]MCW6529534.1 chemotaxis protein CheW [Sphingomonas lycopersici]MCW6534543.1 chemotaxis protein CheW [Sphingomonas lycopersici]OJU22965.1 MAG: hypothetical protein BGN95_06180 [Sphingomonas sp. 66-10]
MSARELHLVGRLGGRGVLFPATQVRRVVDIADIVPVPHAAPAVRGLAALRSRVVTVIDSWRVLDLPSPPPGRHRAVTTAVDGHVYAVLVDDLEDAEPVEVVPLPPGTALGESWAAIATGSAVRDGEPLLAIDLARLIARVG